ncbi:MAG: Glycosyl transferase, group 2 family protein [uncultured bacterium]|nr:MAG: Glycosyl transferase, group 2 family protein [uncultured bacterium]
MAKIKEYPVIFKNFIIDILKGDFNKSSVKLKNAGISTLDKILSTDSPIRYTIWKINNKKKIKPIKNSGIKFAIIYFYKDNFNKADFNKLKALLDKQNYKNYEIFIDKDNLINEILQKNCTHICFVEQKDIISVFTLSSLANLINENTDIIYSDNDVINQFSIRVEPYFKPEYSPLLLYSHNYFNGLLAIKINGNLINELKNIHKISNNEIYKLILRLTRQSLKIKRIPDILYHKHHSNYERDKNISTQETVQNEIKERGLNAKIIDYKHKNYNLIKSYPIGEPLISIIIPFKDKISYLKQCIDSIESKSSYKNYEIVLVNNRSSEPETLDYIEKTKHRALSADIDFNFSRLNNMAAKAASGEYLLLLNNDTEVITPDWLESMLGFAQLSQSGAVGPKLLYPNNRIQHVGIITREKGVNHINSLMDSNKSGYKNYNDVPRECSCLSGACVMISKDKYWEVGGLTEELAVEWNDMDFSLKLINKGYYNVFCPHSVLCHYEKISRRGKHKTSLKQEIKYFMDNWEQVLPDDPFHNPNFSGKKTGFAIKLD